MEVIEDVVHAQAGRALAGASARADLVVLGRNSDKTPGQLKTGAVTHAVLNHAHSPSPSCPGDGAGAAKSPVPGVGDVTRSPGAARPTGGPVAADDDHGAPSTPSASSAVTFFGMPDDLGPQGGGPEAAAVGRLILRARVPAWVWSRALGSLGSRVEDAQTVAGPATIVLVVAYFASFAMIAQPASAADRAISYFPLTAPMAMPGRIAMGATAWWEPVAAAALTLATTAGLVQLAGRIYTSAILNGGPRLSLRDAWRNTAEAGRSAAR